MAGGWGQAEVPWNSPKTVLPLGEDDEDAPMITGFSDDVPMVIA